MAQLQLLRHKLSTTQIGTVYTEGTRKVNSGNGGTLTILIYNSSLRLAAVTNLKIFLPKGNVGFLICTLHELTYYSSGKLSVKTGGVAFFC